jgi:N-acetylneuraminate lyase
MQHFTGLMAAVFTPFNRQGDINLSIIPDYIDKLVSDGLKGIFICGSNGEGPDMTIEERKEVAEAFVRAANKRIQVFVHVGHSCIKDAQELAAHAQHIGADAVSSVSCFYFKPNSIQNLVDCMSEIAGAAPDLPFYYYHIPHLTGLDLDMLQFLQLAEKSIPNLAGIKYTAPKIHEFQTCLVYKQGKYNMLYGTDEMLLPALAVGAQGAIGSTYSFAAPLYYQMMEAFKAGEFEIAKRLHQNLINMIRIILKYPMVSGQKAILKMQGLDLGPCRLPLRNLSAQEYEDLEKELREAKILNKGIVQ